MSETRIGNVDIWVRDDGVCVMTVDDATPNYREEIIIPAEHRPAVALALLGGVTDELVRRAVEGALDGPGVHDDADWDAIRPMVDPLIRGALAAIFGDAAK